MQKNSLVIDVSTIDCRYLENNFFEELIKRCKKIENIDDFILSYKEETPDRIIKISKDFEFSFHKNEFNEKNILTLLKSLFDIAKNKNYENIVLVYGDAPLLDYKAANSLFKIHLDNCAEYTFGESYPEGLTPEFFHIEFLEKIINYELKKPEIDSRKVFDNIQADINQFYVELDLPPIDLTKKRLNFYLKSKRNLDLVKNIINYVKEPLFEDIANVINLHPEVLRIFPKYVEIELTNNCNYNCIFCVNPILTRKKADMDFKLYKKIIDELAANYDDIIVSLGGYGEPLLHPFLEDAIKYNINSGIASTILETNGLNFNLNLDEISPEKFFVIFGVDAIKKESYKKIKNSDKFDDVIKTIKDYIKRNKNNLLRTYVQIVKMKENLHEIDEFFSFWEGLTKNIILQKYNSYAGQILDRTTVDLTPLERIPCWHLQRDLFIFSDGTVPICKQDFQGNKILGNLNNESINEIWQKGMEIYKKDYQNEYSFSLCKDCDEWYIYNF